MSSGFGFIISPVSGDELNCDIESKPWNLSVAFSFCIFRGNFVALCSGSCSVKSRDVFLSVLLLQTDTELVQLVNRINAFFDVRSCLVIFSVVSLLQNL